MRHGLTLLALGFLVLASCSDDSKAPAADTAITPDQAQPDGGAPDQLVPDQGPAPGPLSVTVLKVDGVWDNDFTTAPAAGVTVAADLPGRGREEQTTGADGKVTFKDVAWAQGTAGVTAYLKGYRLLTVMGLTDADGDQTLYLAPLFPTPETVKLSGVAQNPDPAGNYLVVAAKGSPLAYQGVNSLAYSVEVPKNQATTLLGIQAKQLNPSDPRLFPLGAVAWTKKDVPAASADTTVDLDFATKETAVSFSTTFELPTASDSLVGTASRPEVYVASYDGLMLGIPTQSTKLSTTKFKVDAEYVKLSPEAEVTTRYFVFVGANSYGSYVVEDGYPKDGATVTGFLEVPKMVYPDKSVTTVPFYEELHFDNPEAAAEPVALIIDDQAGQILWMLRGAPGMTRLAFPMLPSTATAADVFGSGPVYGRVGMVSDWDSTSLMYKRFSNGPRYAVDPTPPTATCVDKTYQGGAYKFCSELTWAGGAAVCQSHGMRLAKVDDEQENAWILSTAQSELAASGTHDLWIGGNDRETEGTWVWPDGSVFYKDGKATALFTKWTLGEPNNSQGVEDCVELYLGGNDAGRWNDDPCTGKNFVVCETY